MMKLALQQQCIETAHWSVAITAETYSMLSSLCSRWVQSKFFLVLELVLLLLCDSIHGGVIRCRKRQDGTNTYSNLPTHFMLINAVVNYICNVCAVVTLLLA